jgi:predicted chitinase
MIATGASSALLDKFKNQEPQPEPQSKIKPITKQPLESDLLTIAQHEFDWDPIELAQFMAQCAHETMGFQTLEEIGDDNSFKRKYGGPEWKGRGFIQLTGKKNYADFEYNFPNIKLTKNPQVASDPTMAAFIASWWWKNKVLPKMRNYKDTASATRIINGPKMYGLDKRQDYFKQYLTAWELV